MSRRNIAAILAGGSGRRMGGEKPKQLLELAGRTVLERSVDAFDTHPDIDEVIIVSHPDYLTELTEMAARNGWKKVTHIVPGGAERYDSSLAAMQTVTDADANLLIHDAARPLVSAQVIRRVVTALQEHAAVGTALPVVDTLVTTDGSRILSTPDRSVFRRMQTPQGFHIETLRTAYLRALADPHFQATDDCGVVVNYLPEVAVVWVEGEERNRKLTYPEDLPLFERELTAG